MGLKLFFPHCAVGTLVRFVFYMRTRLSFSCPVCLSLAHFSERPPAVTFRANYPTMLNVSVNLRGWLLRLFICTHLHCNPNCLFLQGRPAPTSLRRFRFLRPSKIIFPSRENRVCLQRRPRRSRHPSKIIFHRRENRVCLQRRPRHLTTTGIWFSIFWKMPNSCRFPSVNMSKKRVWSLPMIYSDISSFQTFFFSNVSQSCSWFTFLTG